MTDLNKTRLPSLLIALVLGLGATLLFLFSLVSGAVSIFNLLQGASAPAVEMITAVVFLFEGLLAALCAWFVFQKTTGNASAERPLQLPFANFYVPAVLIVVFLSLSVGAFAAWQDVPFLSWAVLPLPTILVIGLPIWLLLTLGGRGISLGARWRFFSVLGLGLTLAPFLMIALEIAALLAFAAAAAGYAALLQPGLLNELLRLAELIRAESDPNLLLQTLAPYLFRPAVVAAMLLYVSVIVPLIEELFKPLAVWLFAASLETPAQGFVLGLLSGAAFALLESLNAGADGSPAWGAVASVRALTALLHITASGLVGWGVVSMFKEKRFFRFLGAFFCASLLHGLWNACALVTGLSSVGYMLGVSSWTSNVFLAALGGMCVIVFGAFLMLLAANRAMRSQTSL